MLLTRVRQIVAEALPESMEFALTTPPDAKFGDLATNVALLFAKKLDRNPREVAEEIIARLNPEFIEKAAIAGPGFINLFLKPTLFHAELAEIERSGESFGSVDLGKKQKVLLEFISANPTGPLTIANGRGGFGGDVLARVLRKAGYEVATEYYVNNAGNQIETLGKSIHAAVGKIPDEETFYKGEYIKELAEQASEKISEDALETGKNFANTLIETEIKPVVEKMNVRFDHWFLESELHEQKLVEKYVEQLGAYTFQQDGATWLRTTDFGDDKDRVLRKASGEWTYFAADIAYHADKFARADKLINIYGADHHGYVARLHACSEILGRKDDLAIIITQLVKLFRDGAEMKMSKRAGNFELMSELIQEVGSDATRWFFIMREWNTHLNFDLDLAKSESQDNPVYYVQYAHTRLASILARVEGRGSRVEGDLKLLVHPAEFALIKKMAELPELVGEIARSYGVNILTTYARELAETFHRFYTVCRVIDENNSSLSAARLRLTAITKTVLHIVLTELIGVSAPEKM